ncbi:MAG: alpha/beta fold hydrolase [Sandaracinaceae bacterium]
MLVDTRLGRLFVEERGEGEPLFLWHSLLCEGSMWRYVVPRLSERYRVINVDAPGHGRSQRMTRRFTLEECADAAVELYRALGIDDAHWVGLSFGGMVGMRLALAHPERVRSLALLDTSAAPEVLKKLPKYHALAFIARRFGPVPALLDRIVPVFFTARSIAERRDDLIEPFRAHLARMDPESLGHCVDAVIFERRDLRDRLSRIRQPTLVLIGEADVATPIERAREIADGIPDARLVRIPNAAHLSALEQPEAVTEQLFLHLARAAAADAALAS